MRCRNLTIVTGRLLQSLHSRHPPGGLPKVMSTEYELSCQKSRQTETETAKPGNLPQQNAVHHCSPLLNRQEGGGRAWGTGRSWDELAAVKESGAQTSAHPSLPPPADCRQPAPRAPPPAIAHSRLAISSRFSARKTSRARSTHLFGWSKYLKTTSTAGPGC